MTSAPRTKQPITQQPGDHYVLRLYVTGSALRSLRAVENARRLCAEHLAGRHELEVIDIHQRPEASREARIVVAPTLVRLLPTPTRRVIGDLSDHAKVLAALSIVPHPAGSVR